MTRNGLVKRRTKIGDRTKPTSFCLALASALAVLAGPVAGSARAADAAQKDDPPIIGLGTGGLGGGGGTAPTLRALRELSSEKADKIPNNRRIALVKQVVDGADGLLPTMHDPEVLMNYTSQFVSKGISPDINTMEYWGEDPALQARVKPAADAGSNMLEQVSVLAEAQAKQIVTAGIQIGSDRDRWQKLDELKDQAKYFENMIAYYRAIAIDTSGSKNAAAAQERARICDEAIKYLKDPFDQPGDDGGGVQPLVHNRIGKLAMAKGDYQTAKSCFRDMVSGKTSDGKAIDPAPTPAQVYEARYFSLVCDILNKKPDSAEKGLPDLEAWQKKALPADAQSGVEVAADMLRYRIVVTKANLARRDADRQQLNQQADGMLMALEKAHLEFTSIVTQQLVKRLPENANLNEQSVSVLQALIAKGNTERIKPETVPLDEKVVDRAVAAAKVLISHKEGVTPPEAQGTTLFIGVLLDRQNKPLEAADAYLDYADHYGGDPNAGAAVDRALTLAYSLGHGARKDEPEVKRVYGRALSTAVNPPWSRKGLSAAYADYLRSTGK